MFFGHIVLWIYFDEEIVAKTITDNHGAMDRTQSRRNPALGEVFLGNRFDSNMDGTMFAPYLR